MAEEKKKWDPVASVKIDGGREEQKRYWKWRGDVGRLLKKEIPDHILIPVSKERFMEMYKEGMAPKDVRDYIVYQLL